jgi:uncharacterized iron-regulated protein
MKSIYSYLIVCLISVNVFGQGIQPFVIFDKNGNVSEFQAVAKSAASSNLVLFGELHDNPIAHWLERILAEDLYKTKNGNLIIGAEMFETDNQLLLDEYINGLISRQRFEAEAKLWPNYKTDYKPIVEFAKENKVKFIASNVPRRYASMVAGGGFDTLKALSPMAKSYIAPLPIEFDINLSGYKKMLAMGGMPSQGHSNSEYLPMAQALKDATMAHNIVENLIVGHTFIHFHGSYHSNNFEGIYWYVKRYKPSLKVLTIATVMQEDLSSLYDENKNLADYIIVVTDKMTRTY